MAALIPVLFFGLLMWVLLIRPQQQRVRRQQLLVRALEVGDSVITIGGIYGTIVELDDEDVTLEVAENTHIRLIRAAISRRLTTDDDDPEADEYEDDVDHDEIATEPAGSPDTEND